MRAAWKAANIAYVDTLNSLDPNHRVTDNLHEAEMTNTGLGKPRLMAKAEAVRDAHWAFLKH
jgi:hypothetical protein